MNRLLYSFLCIGIFSLAPIGFSDTTQDISNGFSLQIKNTWAQATPPATPPPTPPATPPQQPSSNNQQPISFKGTCTLYNPLSWFSGCLTPVIIPVGGLMVRIGAGVFDVFLNLTLNPEYLRTNEVLTTWALMRDLANLTFIFGIIAAAFMMITGVSIVGIKSWQNILTRLIIVALLLNFSMFFSRVIIDAGNIMGNFFYNVISEGAPNSDLALEAMGIFGMTGQGAAGDVKSVAGAVTQSVNLTSLLDQAQVNKINSPGNNKHAFWFMFNIVYIFACGAVAFSLFKAGFLMLSRTVYLIVLTVVSPFAFVLYFLPKGEQLAISWFNQIFSKSFCICVYLFFIYLLLVLSDSTNVSGATLTDTDGSFAYIKVMLLVTIKVSLVYILIDYANSQAQKMCEGSNGGIGSFVSKWAVGTAAVAGSTAFKPAQMFARAGVGSLGHRWEKSAGNRIGDERSSVAGAANRALGQFQLYAGQNMSKSKMGLPKDWRTALKDEGKEIKDQHDIVVKSNTARLTKEYTEEYKSQGMSEEDAKKLAGKDAAKEAERIGKAYGERVKDSTLTWLLAGAVPAGQEGYDKINEEGKSKKEKAQKQTAVINEQRKIAAEAARDDRNVTGIMAKFINTVTDDDQGFYMDKRSVQAIGSEYESVMQGIQDGQHGELGNLLKAIHDSMLKEEVGADGKLVRQTSLDNESQELFMGYVQETKENYLDLHDRSEAAVAKIDIKRDRVATEFDTQIASARGNRRTALESDKRRALADIDKEQKSVAKKYASEGRELTKSYGKIATDNHRSRKDSARATINSRLENMQTEINTRLTDQRDQLVVEQDTHLEGDIQPTRSGGDT